VQRAPDAILIVPAEPATSGAPADGGAATPQPGDGGSATVPGTAGSSTVVPPEATQRPGDGSSLGTPNPGVPSSAECESANPPANCPQNPLNTGDRVGR
jgi:hypothetical protein